MCFDSRIIIPMILNHNFFFLSKNSVGFHNLKIYFLKGIKKIHGLSLAWIFHEDFFIPLKNSEYVGFLGYLRQKTKNTICNSSLSASKSYVTRL